MEKREKIKINYSQEELRKLFDYNNGYLIWKTRYPEDLYSNKIFNSLFANTIAGDILSKKNISRRYITIKINRKQYYAHKLIYKWHYNEEPEEIDHINGNSLDNKIENLRAATLSLNRKNRTKQSNSKTGIIGVRLKKNGKYSAHIQVNGVEKNLGTFFNIEDAIQARLQAQYKYHGKFAGSLEARPWKFSTDR